MRSVLITGCSSGFGLHTAVELARRGWQVIATMRDLGRRGALDEAAARTGAAVDVIELDVCSAESIESAVAKALTLTDGALDAVVHNAGVGDAGYFEDVTDETARAIMETNFFGVLALTRAVLPTMRDRRQGRIVAVSSISGFLATPGFSVYGGSKWALEGWAEALACEVVPFGIDVTLIEPGTYRTGIWHSAQFANPAGSPYDAFVRTFEPRLRAMNDRYGRDPREVAERVAKVLTVRRPSFRNPVGPDAWLARIIGHTVPFRMRRGLITRLTGARRIRV